MNDAEFWTLIDRVGTVRARHRVAALRELLQAQQPEELTGFADRLHESLERLATPAHAQACNGVGDAFLYMRCAVVLAGSTTYRSVVDHPRAMAGFENREAELLLDVAAQAYESSTGLPWDHYPNRDDDDGYSRWLIIFPQSEDPWGPAQDLEYELIASALVDELCHSEQWQSWWATTEREELEVELHLEDPHPGPPQVRWGRRIVRLVVHWPFYGFSAPQAPQHRQAYGDIMHLLAVVQQELALPALPPLPEPAPLDPAYVEQQRQARM